MNETLQQKYDRLQSIREWNAKFRVPEVCTAKWTADDHQRWEDGRKPLPPFEEWKTQQP